jgi:LPS-assembly lipoprotein
VLAVVAALALGACGFRPLYAPASSGADVTRALAAVSVSPVPDRAGQIYRNTLERLLAGKGDVEPNRYRLDSGIEISETGLAINEDATASRYNVTVKVVYRLVAVRAGENNADLLLSDGTVSQINSYNQITAPYAILVSRQDAIERALEEAAREVQIRLAIYFDQNPA